MNLDESPCCPRRRKRKRRRLESNSEEEDETYTVESNGLYNAPRKRFKKMSKINLNGKVKSIVVQKQSIPIPIRPRPSSFLTGPSQSMTKCDSSTVDSENIILPSSSVINSNASRYDSNVQQPSLYHTTFMNSAGSNTYIRTVNPATMNPAARNRIIVPVQASLPPSIQSSTSYQPIKSSTSYQPSQSLQSPQNAMVSIPNPTDKRGRSLFLLPKSSKIDLTLTPNIIDLDSDSDDEPKVVEEQNNSIANGYDEMDTENSCNKVVPVALTWENNSDDDGIREEQPLREISTTLTRNVTSFSEMMLPHNQDLYKMLSGVKKKMNCFFDLNVTQDVELAAQQKIKQFCLNMREVVLQLANINDRIVREYYAWRRSRKETETETPSSIDENVASHENRSQENVEIPLDMTCINDSDTEFDCEGSIRIKKPSDLVQSGNIVENLLFSKKTVVHRGTGDDKVHLYVDKMTQVCNISKDYEKDISYSIVTKSNNDSNTEYTSILKQTLTDKNFGKYEEQFISFLQHIEDHGIQAEDAKNLVDLNKEPLQELIETNSSFNSHLFQNIDSPDIISEESKICEQEKSEESDSNDHINTVTDIDTLITDTLKSAIDNDNQEIDNDSDSEDRIQEINDIRIQGTVVLDEKLQQTHDTMDGETASIISNDEDTKSSINDSNMINMEVSASKGNEEDCTILDD